MITVFALTPFLHVFGHICNINERVERNAQVPVSVSHQSHERNHAVNSLDNELLYSPMSSIRHFIDFGPESWQGKVCLMSQTGTFVISHVAPPVAVQCTCERDCGHFHQIAVPMVGWPNCKLAVLMAFIQNHYCIHGGTCLWLRSLTWEYKMALLHFLAVMTISVSQIVQHCFKLKYLNNYGIDSLEILYRSQMIKPWHHLKLPASWHL